MSNKELNQELEKLKSLNKKELLREIKIYKFLKFMGDTNVNFIISLILVMLPIFIFNGTSLLVLIFATCFHYFFVWKFLYKKKDFNLVSKSDQVEINIILENLNELVKNK